MSKSSNKGNISMQIVDNDMVGINLSENSSAIHEALRK